MQKWQKIAGGATAVALGAGITASRRWWTGGPSLAEADRAAQDEHALFDRGLIGIERSGWTMPEGEAPPFPMLEESLSADVVIVGAGLAGSSIAPSRCQKPKMASASLALGAGQSVTKRDCAPDSVSPRLIGPPPRSNRSR